MRKIVLLALVALAGCAANPEKVSSVAKTESARLVPPTKALSTYASYELLPMVLSPAVKSEPAKVEEARKLEATLREQVQPLLDNWASNPAAGSAGTVAIEPRLAGLKIVSGGARFWAGAFAGNSSIDLDLVITDKATGEELAKVRVDRDADAMTGAWSIGQSDENLHGYIARIAYQYLVDNY
jgi:hypothetical protein